MSIDPASSCSNQQHHSPFNNLLPVLFSAVDIPGTVAPLLPTTNSTTTLLERTDLRSSNDFLDQSEGVPCFGLPPYGIVNQDALRLAYDNTQQSLQHMRPPLPSSTLPSAHTLLNFHSRSFFPNFCMPIDFLLPNLPLLIPPTGLEPPIGLKRKRSIMELGINPLNEARDVRIQLPFSPFQNNLSASSDLSNQELLSTDRTMEGSGVPKETIENTKRLISLINSAIQDLQRPPQNLMVQLPLPPLNLHSEHELASYQEKLTTCYNTAVKNLKLLFESSEAGIKVKEANHTEKQTELSNEGLVARAEHCLKASGFVPNEEKQSFDDTSRHPRRSKRQTKNVEKR